MFATSMPHLSAIEAVGVAVALVVLVAVLGSLLAGLVPLATALLGVGLARFADPLRRETSADHASDSLQSR